MERPGGGKGAPGGGGGGGGGAAGGKSGGGGSGRGRDQPRRSGGESAEEGGDGLKGTDAAPAGDGGVKNKLGAPSTPRTVSPISYTRPSPLARAARNFTVMDFNGSTIDVRNRWRRSVLEYRLWCYNNSDMRYEFGHPERRCWSLPPAGHFLVYMHYDGKWMCAVIDGPSGYLDGYITRSTGGGVRDLRIRENMEQQEDMKTSVKYIQHAKKLPWDGGYVFAEDAKCGDESLIHSFLQIYRHVEGHVPKPTYLSVVRAGETMILHFSEAGRSDELYLDILHLNFRAAHCVGPAPIIKARTWKTSCTDVYAALGVRFQETGDKAKGLTGNDVAKAKVYLEDIRQLHRPQHKHGYFLLKDMPMHLSKDGPVDATWAETELANSHKMDFEDESWEFLMCRFSWSKS
ncbi:hypothetical protein ACP4OV_014492 [Aristida adscensionis]